MSDLLKMAELTKAEQPKNRVFYRCEKPETPMFGLSEDSVIVTGLILAHYYTVAYDFVDAEIESVGAEATIIVPDDLEEGAIYEAMIVNEQRDWESGHIDDYDIGFSRVTDTDELAWIEAMREEECMYEEAYNDSIHNKVMLT